MSGRSFWVLSFLLLTAACHLGFILFLPGVDSKSLYQDLVALTGTNRLKALDVREASQLSSSSDAKLVHAVCAFDLSRGPVQLKAKFPQSYWSVNVYSTNGDVLYTLNDRQANTSNLSIIISKSGGAVDANAASGNAPAANSDIEVVSDEPRGLAVLRSSLVNVRERKRVTDILSQSACGPLGSV